MGPETTDVSFITLKGKQLLARKTFCYRIRSFNSLLGLRTEDLLLHWCLLQAPNSPVLTVHSSLLSNGGSTSLLNFPENFQSQITILVIIFFEGHNIQKSLKLGLGLKDSWLHPARSAQFLKLEAVCSRCPFLQLIQAETPHLTHRTKGFPPRKSSLQRRR